MKILDNPDLRQGNQMSDIILPVENNLTNVNVHSHNCNPQNQLVWKHIVWY